jgi:L-fuconolactonase
MHSRRRQSSDASNRAPPLRSQWCPHLSYSTHSHVTRRQPTGLSLPASAAPSGPPPGGLYDDATVAERRSAVKLAECGFEPAVSERVIEPELPIVDAHHHLWPSGYWIPYDRSAFQEDLNRGHDIVSTVFVECGAAYRSEGDPALRPVGETEFVVRVCPEHETPALAGGIVAWADLTQPAEAARTLDAHLEAAGSRLCGIRHNVVWHPQPGFVEGSVFPPHLLLDDRFRAGLTEISQRHLPYDVWLFHEQLPELVATAEALPDLVFVLDHLGGPVPDEPIPHLRSEIFARWRSLLTEVARCPNVVVKIGGMGMPKYGFGFEQGPDRPSSAELAAAWSPYVETAIEAFGPARCMFESNFPVDKQSVSYDALWNAFKVITAAMSNDERADLFSSTAQRVYGLA